jgi:hypothetical protein
VDALTRALLDAKSVALSSSVSGDYFTKELFPRLGIAEQMAAEDPEERKRARRCVDRTRRRRDRRAADERAASR